MTCTHAGIFSPTHRFPEVKFPCLCGGGGGGVLPFYPHFPEVKFLRVWWGGGHFYDSKQAGGGGYYAFPHVERFPRFHIFPFSTCPLV